VVSFTSRLLYPRGKSPGTHWIGGWEGPRTALNDVEKRNFLTLPGLELRSLYHPARSQSLYRLSYPGSLNWDGVDAFKELIILLYIETSRNGPALLGQAFEQPWPASYPHSLFTHCTHSRRCSGFSKNEGTREMNYLPSGFSKNEGTLEINNLPAFLVTASERT
jgi:hypothetical protein